MGINYVPDTISAGEIPPASKLNRNIRDFSAGLQAAWDTYTVATSAITLGNGTLVGKWRRVGKTVQYRIKLTFGSSTSFTAGQAPLIGLPIAAAAGYANSDVVGTAGLFDVSATARYAAAAFYDTGSGPKVFVVSGSALVTSAAPFAWAVGDTLTIEGEYETDDAPGVLPGAVPSAYMSGGGSPEGVVTAPVGTIYIDNLATLGAVQWVKATGAGNTGWKVVYGDTGWRNVASSLVNGWAEALPGSVLIKRTGAGVEIRYRLKASAATGTAVMAIPTGFRNDGDALYPMHHPLGPEAVLGAGVFYVDGYNTAYTDMRLSAFFTTTDPWPTALPGVAAP